MVADTNERCEGMLHFVLTVTPADSSHGAQDIAVESPDDITQSDIIGRRCRFGDDAAFYEVIACRAVAQSAAQEVDSTP